MAKLKWIGPMFGGVALGVAAAVLWPSSHAEAPKAIEVASRDDREALEHVRTQAEYLAAVRAVASASQHSPAEAPPAPKVQEVAVPAGRPTGEELKHEMAAAEANQANRLDQHRAERRDDGWASPMETRIDTLVRARSGNGFGVGKYEGAQCRSQSCAVNFSWASYAEARGDIRGMMARTGALPCAASLVLPSDDGSGGRVSASVYLDCAAERNPALSASP